MILQNDLPKGVLYIIGLPIGNPKDITLRALETLKAVDIILAEDTRVLGRLLSYYSISHTRIYSYHSYNEILKAPKVLEWLKSQSVALVSDAGTPLISDPGHILITTLIENHIKMTCIPGPSALTTALPLSGFPLESFFFKGFLSSKLGKKKKQIEKLKDLQTVYVIYESCHRIRETLKMLAEILGSCQAMVCRELTKTYETFYRGTLIEIYNQVLSNNFVSKGEFVIIVNCERDISDSSKDFR